MRSCSRRRARAQRRAEVSTSDPRDSSPPLCPSVSPPARSLPWMFATASRIVASTAYGAGHGGAVRPPSRSARRPHCGAPGPRGLANLCDPRNHVGAPRMCRRKRWIRSERQSPIARSGRRGGARETFEVPVRPTIATQALAHASQLTVSNTRRNVRSRRRRYTSHQKVRLD